MREGMENACICFDKNCNENHANQIVVYFECFTIAIKQSASNFAYANEIKLTAVPGWNKVCKKKYKKA